MGDARGARQTLGREITRFRRGLDEDPLEPQRLERLAELLETLRARDPADADLPVAIAAVGAVRGVLAPGGAPPAPERTPRPLALAAAGKSGGKTGAGSGSFWTELAHPGALGFAAEIWPHLHESAAALHPPPADMTLGREARIAP